MSRHRFAHCERCGMELTRGRTLWEYDGCDLNLCGTCAAFILVALISALSEIGDAIETRMAGGPAWRTETPCGTCGHAHNVDGTCGVCPCTREGRPTDTEDALLDVNMALERALLRLVDVLRDGAQV